MTSMNTDLVTTILIILFFWGMISTQLLPGNPIIEHREKYYICQQGLFCTFWKILGKLP